MWEVDKQSVKALGLLVLICISCFVSDPLPDTELAAVEQRQKRRKYPEYAAMLNKTKALLDEFYFEHNKLLADLLGDKRFLW